MKEFRERKCGAAEAAGSAVRGGFRRPVGASYAVREISPEVGAASRAL